MKTVLERFLADATGDEYAGAVPRPVEASSPGSPLTGTRRAALGMLVLVGSALLALAVVIAILAARSAVEERQGARVDLVARVSSLTAEVEALQESVEASTATVDQLREQILVAQSDPAADSTVAALEVRAGTTERIGPGLVVTIDDAPDAAPGSLNRVLDRDLQSIVNTLWRMGASGIAVNDQRLTSVSSIRGAGEAILVNYQPLTRPYVVQVLGTSGPGDEASDLTELLDGLAVDYGLVSKVEVGDVTLPAGALHRPVSAQTLGGAS